jgi:hypothetical protein
MLLHVSIAHKVFLKPHKARVIVCRAFRKLVAVVFVDWWWCLLIGGDGQWLFLKCCDLGLTSRQPTSVRKIVKIAQCSNTPTTTTCSSCKTIASTCVEFAMASDSPTPSGTSATTSRCTPDVAGASPSGVEDASMLLSTGATFQRSTLFVVVVATSMMALVLF